MTRLPSSQNKSTRLPEPVFALLLIGSAVSLTPGFLSHHGSHWFVSAKLIQASPDKRPLRFAVRTTSPVTCTVQGVESGHRNMNAKREKDHPVLVSFPPLRNDGNLERTAVE
ncbi:MAG: hypothetical protein CMJ81_14245 [Planctomycetaceae bacterium]|nr:hypothetical protein [Planctomycetaceae bacterium]